MLGFESAIRVYLPTFEGRAGIPAQYGKSGTGRDLDGGRGHASLSRPPQEHPLE
jgi:hypothetical protein